MVGDFARELLWPCAIVLDLRHTWDCRDDVVYCDCLETVMLEELVSVTAEQIKMARAARVCGIALRRDVRGADSSPPTRSIHVQRTDQGRIDHRLDANHSDRFIADVRHDVARGRPLDSISHHAGPREHFAHEREVARLLDYEFACTMLAYRHVAVRDYFFGGGNSCTPASSTTVIAFTGHERAAETIIESSAPDALTTSDLPSSSS